MKKQVRKKVIRKKGISIETAMMLMLNAFTMGILLEKILTNGLSWFSTIGYFG